MDIVDWVVVAIVLAGIVVALSAGTGTGAAGTVPMQEYHQE
jgi:hypothetical protein